LLKKHIKNGGSSKTYLGSEDFDKSLIEPIKKIFQPSRNFCIKSGEFLDTANPSFSPKAANNERNINSQPGIPRKNYSFNNYNSLNKKKDSFLERKEYESLQNSARHRQYTPSSKVGS
jgi:hypothetical protein